MVKQKTQFKVGASFFALTFLMLITKNGLFFCYYLLAVILHEVSHAKVANKLGYKTQQIRLSAFGAVLYGEFDEMSFDHQVKIAIAGPFANLCFAVATLALWWLFPSLYAISQPFYMANMCIFAINLLPCYPLDGGRLLFAFLGKKTNEKKAKQIFVSTGLVLSFLFFALFVFLFFSGVTNFTFGLFGLFLFVSATDCKKQRVYQRVVGLNISKKRLQKGLEVRTIALSCDNEVGCLAKYCCSNVLYNVQVVDDDNKVVAVFAFDELTDIVVSYPLNTKLKQID